MRFSPAWARPSQIGGFASAAAKSPAAGKDKSVAAADTKSVAAADAKSVAVCCSG